MFRPEAKALPGETITLDLAPSSGQAVQAQIVPITGASEIWLAEQRRQPGAGTANAVETLMLKAGMVRLSGEISDPGRLLIGDRNRLTLAVLCVGYGAPRDLLATCPDCGEAHDVPFDPSLILGAVPRGPVGDMFDVSSGDETIRMRLPMGADIAAIGTSSDTGGRLLGRCAPELADHADIEVIEAEITARDPCAELNFCLVCMECGRRISAVLDPLAILLTEMDRLGGILAEIDRLARAYHWSEAELLALPAYRRRMYLRTLDDTETGLPRQRAS